MIGITAEDLGSEAVEIEVWPENWRTVDVFCKMSTQWRHGFGGPTGLIYSELETILRLVGLEVTAEEQRELFEGVRTMERAALDTLATRNKKASK